jgi:hypothetical protein
MQTPGLSLEEIIVDRDYNNVFLLFTNERRKQDRREIEAHVVRLP